MDELDDRLRIEADVLRCGYNAGYFNKADVERWAECKIAALDDPPADLIELATIQRTHPLDVIKLLTSLSSSMPASNSIGTQIGFIGLAFGLGKLSLRGACRGLYALAHFDGITSEQQSEIYSLDDGYDLALCGTYGTMEDIEAQLLEFVRPFVKELDQQYPSLMLEMKIGTDLDCSSDPSDRNAN
jgi:hypothetical protein